MASITIKIQRNEGIRYSPGPYVQQGDTVTFQLVGISGDVAVSFDGGNSCFIDSGPILLSGKSLMASSSQHVVSPTASGGWYPFTVSILPDDARPDEMQQDSKTGGIDVTTDPPDGNRR